MQAEGFAEIQEQHAAFVETFNTTPHWAPREREDGPPPTATPAASHEHAGRGGDRHDRV